MRAAAEMPALQFIDQYVLGPRAFVFAWLEEPYLEFRRSMEGLLATGGGDIKLIGSAKLGFSLNPDHLLRPFRGDSDLDLVVVSSQLFDAALLELRQRSPE